MDRVRVKCVSINRLPFGVVFVKSKGKPSKSIRKILIDFDGYNLVLQLLFQKNKTKIKKQFMLLVIILHLRYICNLKAPPVEWV